MPDDLPGDTAETLTLYRKHMAPEALAPGVPLAVREAIRTYSDGGRRNLRPQLLSLWVAIRGELALFAREDACELPHARLAELAGVGVNQVGRYVAILVELSLLVIVGERQGAGACRPSPVYDIDHVGLLRRSEGIFMDACAWRGIRRPPPRRVGTDQLQLFDEPPSPPGGRSLPGGGGHHSQVVGPSLPGGETEPPSLAGDGRQNEPNSAAEWGETEPPSLAGGGAHHLGVMGPSLPGDGGFAHVQTHVQTHESVVDAGPAGADLIGALRAILPELLTEIAASQQNELNAPREFSPPEPLEVPEPAAGRAALPAHPWRLWVAACPTGATERDWLTLAWLAGQHGWHWVGEAILQLANGSGIDSTKRIKVKLDWWARHDNYGCNNRSYERMLAGEEAALPMLEPAAAPTQVAQTPAREMAPTEQYLIEQGFAAKTAGEFAHLDLAAVRAEVGRAFLSQDTAPERNRKIGQMVTRWRRSPPEPLQSALPTPVAEPEPTEEPEPQPEQQEEPGELARAWQHALGTLRMTTDRTVQQLLDGCWLADVAEGLAVVACANPWQADQLGRQASEQIAAALAGALGAPVQVQIVVRR